MHMLCYLELTCEKVQSVLSYKSPGKSEILDHLLSFQCVISATSVLSRTFLSLYGYWQKTEPKVLVHVFAQEQHG